MRLSAGVFFALFVFVLEMVKLQGLHDYSSSEKTSVIAYSESCTHVPHVAMMSHNTSQPKSAKNL